MSKSDPAAQKKERRKTVRWVLTIFLVTLVVSSTISLVSDRIMSASGMLVAFLILLAIILLGILFDIIGMAVASADEKPFHSMAARKVPGAKQSLMLLRNAERVSSICNDVVGDICGVISGSAAAAISMQVLQKFTFSWPQIVSLIMSSLVAGLTVGGKAVCKGFAIRSSTSIVSAVGRLLYFLGCGLRIFKKQKKSK